MAFQQHSGDAMVLGADVHVLAENIFFGLTIAENKIFYADLDWPTIKLLVVYPASGVSQPEPFAVLLYCNDTVIIYSNFKKSLKNAIA